jgi:protein TonB
MPQYPGGDEELFKYLATNIKYPSDAKEQNIEGRVICQFIINRDGSVSEVVVVRSITPSLDAEAVRVISAMPNWTPGEQRAQTVRVKYTLPINFKLEGKEKIEKTTEN